MSVSSLFKRIALYPKEIQTVFLSQACFNFSFMGFKSLFVLYAFHHVGLPQKEAIRLFAILMTLSYASSLLGGYLSDKILKPVRCQLLGGILCILSIFTFLYSTEQYLYLAMALFSIGSGCLKPNISALLASFFEDPQDPARDTAFTHLYLCMNIGNFLGPLLCSFISYHYGWEKALVTIAVIFAIGTSVLLPLKRRPALDQRLTLPRFLQASLITGLSIAVISYLLKSKTHESILMSLIVGFSIFAFAFIYYKSNALERKGLHKIMGYILCFTCFCSLFEQAGSTIMLFMEKGVNRHLLGYLLPSSSLLSLNPVYVLILGLILPVLTRSLFRKRKPLEGLGKISIGFIFVGLSFAILALSASQAQPLAPLSYILLAFLFQTMGELYIVPITLSNMTKYGPPRHLSIILSFWLMAIGYGHYLAGVLSRVFLKSFHQIEIQGMAAYGDFFIKLCILAIIMALGLGFISYRQYLSSRKQE